MGIKVIYEDKNVLVIDKPAGIVVYPPTSADSASVAETTSAKGAATAGKEEKTLIDYLLEKYPVLKNVGKVPRYGIAHRLDKDTSGILLVAKNNKSLIFLQKQFKKGEIEKKYIALAVGKIEESKGEINTLIGRSPKNGTKQKVYLPLETSLKRKRKAITKYKVTQRLKGYTLLEIIPKTGRKHQIRCHLVYLGHPIAGDKIYGFKNQPCPKELDRQFLHASFLKIKLPNGKDKEFISELPEDLRKILNNLKSKQ